MMKTRRMPIGAVAGGLTLAILSFAACTMPFEDRFIFFPTRQLEGTPVDFGMDYQDVYFTSGGHKLHGWFVPGQSDYIWLWVHGNAGNISHRLDNMRLLQDKLKVGILIFDYRGYGLSEGTPSEGGTYEDASAALSHLLSLPEADGRKIVLFGRSLEAAVALQLAVSEPDQITALILESAFTSVPDMARDVYPFLPIGSLLRTRYDSLSRIGDVKVPVLVVHSLNDEIVPYEHGKRLFEAAPEPKSFHAIASGGHNDTYVAGGEDYWQAIQRFIEGLP